MMGVATDTHISTTTGIPASISQIKTLLYGFLVKQVRHGLSVLLRRVAFNILAQPIRTDVYYLLFTFAVVT